MNKYNLFLMCSVNKLYLFEVLSRVRKVREKALTLANIGNGSRNTQKWYTLHLVARFHDSYLRMKPLGF